MKLVHEMEHRPNFGDKPNHDPDSSVQLSCARVGALMDRVGIRESVQFRARQSSLPQYWPWATSQMQISVRGAIEALKLELELNQNNDIGKVYDQGQEFSFVSDFLKIVESATEEIFVVDPYFDGSAFVLIFGGGGRVGGRVLLGQYHDAVVPVAQKLKSERFIDVELRKTRELHDRAVFVDGKDAWLMGGSIKDAGKKPTYLMPLPPELGAKKLEIYLKLWISSKQA